MTGPPATPGPPRRAVLLLPGPQRGGQPRAAGRRGARDAARARGAASRSSSSTTARATRPPASPIGWPPPTRTSSGRSTTRRTCGYGAALRSGFRAARFGLVAFTDGDRQFRVADLGRLTARMGAADRPDVVIGYRIRRADPLIRTLYARAYRLANRIFFGLRSTRRRLRLQALPARGARGRQGRVGRRVPLGRAADQAARARAGASSRSACRTTRGRPARATGRQAAGHLPRRARLLAAPPADVGRTAPARSRAANRSSS